MRRKWILLPLLCCLPLAGCATHYTNWQGGGVQVGSGGACASVDGLEVWSHGRPNRPYTIMGLIEDSRPSGPIPMAMRQSAVVRAAKAKGADGVILMDDSKEYMGSVNTMNAYSTMNATTAVNANTQFYPRSAYTTGTATTTGSVNTFGSGISAPMFRSHGTYQAFKYVR